MAERLAVAEEVARSNRVGHPKTKPPLDFARGGFVF